VLQELSTTTQDPAFRGSVLLGDDEDENMEHRGRSLPAPWRDLNCRDEYAGERAHPCNYLISQADQF
jgi:hypothetical protein